MGKQQLCQLVDRSFLVQPRQKTLEFFTVVISQFTQAGMHRVFLEKVNGQYQGACFPFRSGFASAVLRIAQGNDGSLFAGLTNRGWSSLGDASYGLQRVTWNGKTPFEIHSMHARPDGFELALTRPVDRKTAVAPEAYDLSSYTYLYHSTYGSDEIQRRELEITAVEVSEDGMRVRLTVSGLRKYFVHELVAHGLRDEAGFPLLHANAYYTLNAIPTATVTRP